MPKRQCREQKGYLPFFSAYAPQVGRSDEEKSEFWEKLEDEVAGILGEDGVIVGRDMNPYIGAMRVG